MASGTIPSPIKPIAEGGTGAGQLEDAQTNMGISSFYSGTYTGTTSGVGYISVGSVIPSGTTAILIIPDNTNYQARMVNGNQCQVTDYNGSVIKSASVGVRWIAVKIR